MKDTGAKDGLLDQLGGVDGMLDRVEDMTAVDKLQLTQMLEGMRQEGVDEHDGRDGSTVKQMSGHDFMHSEMSKMLDEALDQTVNNGKTYDVLTDSQVEGKIGIIDEMGLLKGNGVGGEQVSQMLQELGQGIGHLVGDLATLIGGDVGDFADLFGTNSAANGGCDNSFCCGHTLQWGVW